jgi:hypothetical protein
MALFCDTWPCNVSQLHLVDLHEVRREIQRLSLHNCDMTRQSRKQRLLSLEFDHGAQI